ncbi:MAG: phosphoglycolate phosphatase [Thermoplasmata archaeon]|nr:phosphoglycolate phosphatase [Thermoplasmata archaeon]
MGRGGRAPPKGSDITRRQYALVVTDVDGTLTDASRRLDPEALRCVRALEDRQIPVVLATGNVLPIALALHRSLGLTGPIVAENGGMLWWKGADGRDRVRRLADRRPALVAYRVLRRAGLPVRRLFTDRWRESEVALEPNVSVAAVRACVRSHPIAVESTGYAIHLMERGAGKAPALVRALAPLGWSLADAVVLGDGDNDVQMLRAAGFGVSFPSGSPRARAAADYVTKGSYSLGFVEGLKASRVLGRTGSILE